MATKNKEKRLIKEDYNGLIQSIEEAAAGQAGTKTRRAKIVIVSEGFTKNKRRFYTKEALKTGFAIFKASKMYLNHPTEQEDSQRPERRVEDYVATIENAYYEEVEGKGQIIGEAIIHGSPTYEAEKLYGWVKSLHKGGISPEISMNAFVVTEAGEVDGIITDIIVGIEAVRSVDFVTIGNAGGVVNVIESKREEGGEEEMFDLKKLTIEELKETRPDLIEKIQSETKEAFKMDEETKKAVDEKDKEIKKLQESLKEKEDALKAKELTEKQAKLISEAYKMVEEAKLPEETAKRIKARVDKMKVEEATESFKDEVTEEIAAEREYLKSLKQNKVFAHESLKEGEEKKDESIDSLVKEIAESKAESKKK